MQYFPRLSLDGIRWYLPMADSTAAALAEVLFAPVNEKRRAILAGALASDPAALLWTCCRAWHDSDGRFEPHTVSEAAEWLGGRLPFADFWQKPDPPEQLQTDSHVDLWRYLVLYSAQIACAAAHEVVQGRSYHWSTLAADPNLANREDFFLGLLYGAPAWLDSCTDMFADPDVTEALFEGIYSGEWSLLREEFAAADTPSPLPKGLAAALARLEQDKPLEKPFEERVRAAIIQYADMAEYDEEPDESLLEPDEEEAPLPCVELAGGFQRQWAASLPGPGRDWYSLVGMIEHYRALDEDFQQQLFTERLESLREFAYGAGHELNNPLTNISSRAQALLRDELDDERRNKLALIHRHAMRAHEMIADLAAFARVPQLQYEEVVVEQLIAQVIDQLGEEANKRSVTVTLHGSEKPQALTLDKVLMAAAFDALLRNAIESFDRMHLPSARTVTVNTREIAPELIEENDHAVGAIVQRLIRRPAPPESWLAVTITDNGPGMDSRERLHMYDPYFSGREAGRGLGFGLSKCSRIITLHHGELSIESEEDRGTTATIVLPIR